MFSATPVPFDEALQYLRRKAKLPTWLRTWALDTLAPELHERVITSAAVTDAQLLQYALDEIRGIVEGTQDLASARKELRSYLDRTGYQPEPGREGTLRDLRSVARLNVFLKTNIAQAHGYAQRKQGLDPDVLDEFPAQELVRFRHPLDPKNQRDWEKRWRNAGGRFVGGGRMIALKTDPIWERISRFGQPYPPFDFNSGMGVVDIDRDEAEALGLIQPGDTLEVPTERGLNADLEYGVAELSPALKDALVSSSQYDLEFAGDVLRLKGGQR